MEKQREARLREVLEKIVDLQQVLGDVRAEERRDYMRLFDSEQLDEQEEQKLDYSVFMLNNAIESLYRAGREILCAVKDKSFEEIEGEQEDEEKSKIPPDAFTAELLRMVEAAGILEDYAEKIRDALFDHCRENGYNEDAFEVAALDYMVKNSEQWGKQTEEREGDDIDCAGMYLDEYIQRSNKYVKGLKGEDACQA